MKTFLRSLLFTIALLTSLFGLSAASLPHGVDGLRNYALSHTTFGRLYVEAPSLDYSWSENKSWVEATGKNAEEVLNKLLAQKLTYRLANASDNVESYIHLYDVNPKGTDAVRQFYGYAEMSANDLASGKKSFNYNIWMQSIAILDDVSFAELLVLNPDRTTARSKDIEIQNGHVLLDPYLGGTPNVILVVYYSNGTTVSYDLGSSLSSEPSVSINSEGVWSIEGHYVVSTGAKIVKITEVYNRPTVYVPASALHELMFDVVGILQEGGSTSLERPSGYYITINDGEESSIIPCPPSAFTEKLPPGDIRIRFEWNKFEQPYSLYTGEDGPGKG